MKKTLRAMALVALMGLPTIAAAAPPAAPVVLQKLATTQAAPGWAQLELVEIEPPAGVPPGLAVRIAISPEMAIRQDVQRLDSGVLDTRIWAPDAAGVAGALPLTQAPAWLQLLAGRDAARVLEDKQIAVSRTAYGHTDGEIMWVVGAGPREAWTPQVHVARASGRLRRVTEALPVPAGATPQLITTTLGTTPAGEGLASRWPSRLTLLRQGESVARTFEVRQLRLGQALDPALFVVPGRSPALPVR